MDIDQLSRYRNKTEIAAFARGYIEARIDDIDDSFYYEENDEWHAFSEDIDINFYTSKNEIRALAYKVVDGNTDTTTEELVYTYRITTTII